MNNIVLCCCLFLLSSCNPVAQEYKKVIGPQSVPVSIFSSDFLNLAQGEELVLCSENENRIFKIDGEILMKRLDKVIRANTTQSFPSQYLSFMIDNMDKSVRDIEEIVHGGVHRSSGFKWNFTHLELLVGFGELRWGDLTAFPCEKITTYIDDEIFSGNEIIKLDSIRRQDKNTKLKCICEYKRLEYAITLDIPNEINQKKLLLEERNLFDQDYPKIFVMDFYLRNRMYSKALKLYSNKQFDEPLIVKTIETIER